MAIKLPNKALCSENIKQLKRNPFLEPAPLEMSSAEIECVS